MNDAPLRTVQLTSDDDDAVIAFLDRVGSSNPSILGYHYPFYSRALESIDLGTSTRFATFEGDQMVGLLPGLSRRAEAGIVFSSMPFFGANAGVLTDPASDRDAVHRALLDAVRSYMGAQPNPLTASFYTPFLGDAFEAYERELHDWTSVRRTTLWQELDGTPWSKKIRYDIRRAERLGVTVIEDRAPELIDRFYEIYVENCTDTGIPIKPRKIVDALLTQVDAGRVSWHLAMHEGELVAGLLALYGPRTGSYYIPCTARSARPLQPGSVLLDRALEQARERGVTHWNWEGSPSPESGVYQFKKKWGSVESEFRIYVERFQETGALAALGAAPIMDQFPSYFVYPFDQLVTLGTVDPSR